jgi:hypothetical protein
VFLKLFLVVLAMLAIGFAGLAIKIWAKTDGKFDGTCASQNPNINTEGDECSFCGRKPDELHTCEREQAKKFFNKLKLNKE